MQKIAVLVAILLNACAGLPVVRGNEYCPNIQLYEASLFRERAERLENDQQARYMVHEAAICQVRYESFVAGVLANPHISPELKEEIENQER